MDNCIFDSVFLSSGSYRQSCKIFETLTIWDFADLYRCGTCCVFLREILKEIFLDFSYCSRHFCNNHFCDGVIVVRCENLLELILDISLMVSLNVVGAYFHFQIIILVMTSSGKKSGINRSEFCLAGSDDN